MAHAMPLVLFIAGSVTPCASRFLSEAWLQTHESLVLLQFKAETKTFQSYFQKPSSDRKDFLSDAALPQSIEEAKMPMVQKGAVGLPQALSEGWNPQTRVQQQLQPPSHVQEAYMPMVQKGAVGLPQALSEGLNPQTRLQQQLQPPSHVQEAYMPMVQKGAVGLPQALLEDLNPQTLLEQKPQVPSTPCAAGPPQPCIPASSVASNAATP